MNSSEFGNHGGLVEADGRYSEFATEWELERTLGRRAALWPIRYFWSSALTAPSQPSGRSIARPDFSATATVPWRSSTSLTSRRERP